MRTGKRHLFRLIAIAFAVVAAAVPAAQAAGQSPDDRALARGTSAAVAPTTISPDDRGYYRGASATLAPKSLSPDDRAFARSVPGIEARTIPAAVTVPPSGFDWGDAVIGGALGLALALLGAGAVLISVRHRRSILKTV
jgi:hypothetical protein